MTLGAVSDNDKSKDVRLYLHVPLLYMPDHMKGSQSFIHRFRLPESPATLFVMLMALGCALMALFTPYNHDDLHYRLVFLPAGSNGADISGFPSPAVYFDFVRNHYLESNGRLGDKLLPLALLLPKWLFSLLTGLAAYVILDAARFISYRLTGNCMRILCATLLLLSLPWYNLMFTGAFSVNYLWGGALCLIAFSYMTGIKVARSRWGRVAVCLLMLVAGSWHEGYAMVVGAGVFVIFAMRRFRPGRANWLYWALWVCGAALVVLAPSSWDRMDASGSDFAVDRLLDSCAFAYFNIALLYIPLMALALPWRRFRRRAGGETLSLLVGVCVMQIVNLYVIARTYWAPRITIFSSLFVLPALLLALKMLIPRKASGGRTAHIVVASVCAMLATAHLGVSLYWQIRLDREYTAVAELYRASGAKDILYYDLITTEDIPAIALDKPSTYQLHNTWGLTTFVRYYGHGGKSLRILPTRVRNLDPGKEGKRIGGKYDVYIVDGAIYARRLGDKRDYKLTYTYADGTKIRLKTLATTFLTPDSTRYALLTPQYPPFPPPQTPPHAKE